jgi:hypothetical protein
MPKAVSIFIFVVLGSACMLDLEPEVPADPASPASVEREDATPAEVAAGEPVARALLVPGAPVARTEAVADRARPGDAHGQGRPRPGF